MSDNFMANVGGATRQHTMDDRPTPTVWHTCKLPTGELKRICLNEKYYIMGCAKK